MSIETIIDKIIGDAEVEAEKIRKEAQEKILEIEKEAKTKIEEATSQILKRAENESKQKKERIKVQSNLEFKKGILEEKQKAITLAFDLVLKEIQNLRKEEYQDLIEQEFLKSEGIEEVIIPLQEKRIDEDFINRINKILEKRGKSGNLKLSDERRQIPGGGFILKKGNVESNNAFTIILESIRNQLELKISNILFSNGNP